MLEITLQFFTEVVLPVALKITGRVIDIQVEESQARILAALGPAVTTAVVIRRKITGAEILRRWGWPHLDGHEKPPAHLTSELHPSFRLCLEACRCVGASSDYPCLDSALPAEPYAPNPEFVAIGRWRQFPGATPAPLVLVRRDVHDPRLYRPDTRSATPQSPAAWLESLEAYLRASWKAHHRVVTKPPSNAIVNRRVGAGRYRRLRDGAK